ncbi:unnamed protein product [Absidia cylindrospora]
MTRIDHLPVEILHVIASHVDYRDLYDMTLSNRSIHLAVQPVLRRWRTQCRTIGHHELAPFIEELRVSQIRQQPHSLGQHLRSLQLNGYHHTLLLSWMPFVGPQLEELIILACAMTADDFPDLMAAYQQQRRESEFWEISSRKSVDHVLLPNFKALGRLKIQLIRQHSNDDGSYRQ